LPAGRAKDSTEPKEVDRYLCSASGHGGADRIWPTRAYRYRRVGGPSVRVTTCCAEGSIGHQGRGHPSCMSSRSAFPMTRRVLPSWMNTAGPIPNTPVVVAKIKAAMTPSERYRFCRMITGTTGQGAQGHRATPTFRSTAEPCEWRGVAVQR
jgi:hypothetical protein